MTKLFSHFIGVDPSLTATGIVVYKPGYLHSSNYGEWLTKFRIAKDINLVETFKPEGHLNFVREADIAKTIVDFVDYLEKGSRPLVCIEGYSYASKGRGTISLGQLGGAIRMLLWEQDVPFIEFPPTRIKKFCLRKGNTPKERILTEVYQRFGIDFATSDEAIAFCAAYLGARLQHFLEYGAFDEKHPARLSKERLKILKELSKNEQVIEIFQLGDDQDG